MLAAPPNRALNPSSSWWGVLNDGYYHRFTFIEFEKLQAKITGSHGPLGPQSLLRYPALALCSASRAGHDHESLRISFTTRRDAAGK
jgi:hypothetical protein